MARRGAISPGLARLGIETPRRRRVVLAMAAGIDTWLLAARARARDGKFAVNWFLWGASWGFIFARDARYAGVVYAFDSFVLLSD